MLKFVEDLLQGETVEWKRLGEVAKLQRGTSVTKKTSMAGKYPVISGGQHPAYYINQFNREGETITIAGSGAYAGFVMYWNEPIFVSDAFSIKTDETQLLPHYAYYYLQNIQDSIHELKRGGGVPHVYAKDVACFFIPIPPLRVQEKIVEVLDKFTELESTLKAELALRKTQYEYYRNKLLTFDKEVEWIELGEIGDIRMCKRILKNQTSASGDVPFYKIGTFGKKADAYISRALFNEYKAKYNYPKFGDVLISTSGTIGRVVLFDGNDAYFQDSNIVWIENDEARVLNKYLFYCYQIAEWEVTNGGTITRLYNENLRATRIPIPYGNDTEQSLSEQARIVAILDKFDTLVNSLCEGLPREIELRHKQYEYYRDQLLTFPAPE